MMPAEARRLDPPALRKGELGEALVAHMNELTFARHGDLALGNAAANLPALAADRSLRQLRRAAPGIGRGATAVVIAAGPSVRKHDHARQLVEAGYEGAVVAAESSLYYCLSRGLVPDVVVTVDPTRPIVRWFGDPELSDAEIRDNDYFRRQDLADAFKREREVNDELLELVNRHAPDIKLAISTSAHPDVVARCWQAGFQMYWWNPMYDDPADPAGVTARLVRDNGLPAVNAGGNVGTTAWMVAQAALGKDTVALTGIDFGYYAGTPYERTQYYKEIVDLVGEDRVESVIMRIFNPHYDAEFLTDPAYRWFRDSFLELARDARCRTLNCTEGGTLFGEGVEVKSLARFLADDVEPDALNTDAQTVR